MVSKCNLSLLKKNVYLVKGEHVAFRMAEDMMVLIP